MIIKKNILGIAIVILFMGIGNVFALNYSDCAALFSGADAIKSACCDNATRAKVTVTSSLQGGGTDYTYSSKDPFTVTVTFPYTVQLVNPGWPDPTGFTRSPNTDAEIQSALIGNPNPSIAFTYTPLGTGDLLIAIPAGVVSYTNPSESNQCDSIQPDLVDITYLDLANKSCIAPVNGKCPDGSDPVGIDAATGNPGCCIGVDPNAPKDGVGTSGKEPPCDPRKEEDGCCGIKLLTNVPFIGKCIVMISDEDAKTLGIDKNTLEITESTAFPRLMLGLTKILVTVILLASFIAIIVAGVMIAASGAKEEGYSQGTKLIMSVIAALALLGASGVILRLINPNFFG